MQKSTFSKNYPPSLLCEYPPPREFFLMLSPPPANLPCMQMSACLKLTSPAWAEDTDWLRSLLGCNLVTTKLNLPSWQGKFYWNLRDGHTTASIGNINLLYFLYFTSSIFKQTTPSSTTRSYKWSGLPWSGSFDFVNHQIILLFTDYSSFVLNTMINCPYFFCNYFVLEERSQI